MAEQTPAARPWGATREQWLHFHKKLDLTADLLPVVSNPGARISPKSKMQSTGKTPSRYNAEGFVVGIPQWSQQETSARQVLTWAAEPDHGICIQTRRVRALDIDIPDQAAARRVREVVELLLGELPARVREGTGKCLLAFWMPGDFAKRVIRTEHGVIEFLATGQQFIAAGAHIAAQGGHSGTFYEWEGGLPEAFPVVTPAEFDALWQALAEAFALPDGDVRLRTGRVPVVPRVAADGDQDPTVTWLRENGWIREFDRDGRVHITCPWEQEHTMDSGPSATTYFPAGVGGFAQGHFRCLHAHCAHRRDEDFIEAMGLVVDEFDDVSVPAVIDHDGGAGEEGEEERAPWPVLLRDKQGRIESTADNVSKALDCPGMVGVRLGFDDFRASTMIVWEIDGETAWRPIRDSDIYRLRIALEKRGFKQPGKELVRDGVDLIAERHRFDSAIQWAEGLKWDGIERVELFAHVYWGVEDTPYTRALSRYIWTGLAGRCLVPGIKLEQVPVLVGLQGAGKTPGIMAMAPLEEFFVEVDLATRDDNLARTLRGKLVGELAELKGLRSREAESIKAWVSRRYEEWVPKYREHALQFPRRMMFFGTTNDDQFLDDDTGEKRWLPVEVGTVDVAGIEANREQLWAEGVAMFKKRGIDWHEAMVLAREEHWRFKYQDPWAEAIMTWLREDAMDSNEGPPRGEREEGWTASEILQGALGRSPGQVSRVDEKRLGSVLRGLGYERFRMQAGGTRHWRWIRKNLRLVSGRGGE